MSKNVRTAIDVGGTFTDVVKLVPETGELRFEKVPTTPQEPTAGVLAAFDKAEADPTEVGMFNHGTTLGLNSLLTRTGARIATIATRGFRDVYLLGRTDRKVMYDIAFQKPEALLERYDTFEVTERSYFDSEIETIPLDEDDARQVAREIAKRGYDAVAVAFLHSYSNPAHEQRMREILEEEAPNVEVTISHELSREYREYERTSTAVLDAYIKPIMRSYLRALEGELQRRGFGGKFLMSRSGGGAMTASTAREQPVNLILSGPAGGVVGAAAFAKLIGRPNLITIDMGGTSLDASLVQDGSPVSYHGAEFEGLPINTPSLYIHTIGAGGGSLGYLDEAGALQVGPKSAGADPGPAAYGLGGTEPTFTDAALAIGYLGVDTPLGGELTLDRKKSVESLTTIADELGLSVTGLARGMIRISNTKIVGAVRAITIELGNDPKEFSMLSFGGGGGLVAVDVARELDIPEVIVPPGQGAFSALGMLMANVQHDYSRTSIQPLDELDAKHANDLYAGMEAEATETLCSDGFSENRMEFHRVVAIRYSGQEHSVTVDYPEGDGDPRETIRGEFDRLHLRQYGHTMDDPIETTTLRLHAVGLVDNPELPKAARRPVGEGFSNRTRTVTLEGDIDVEYLLVAREDLMAGDLIDGPAVVTEHTATTVLHEGDRLEVGDYGELIIAIKYVENAQNTQKGA
ncbi:hydantoinase/oxoprolinase family protein [Paramicrobacterium chengjingii]|uniref:Hydantoinase/oxoprolinase family protein n=1 Tax=Paramicrobacterium chengjingii TaxID=2769067 RepID=A0ABX6YI55_9MICO|nr:hydantoinase/oxoprolinase family protein [Microbacterium chengjingii]QPZ38390.1 hydantoinase/oxoprolinase family protein [Microbacterium chengjingii]